MSYYITLDLVALILKWLPVKTLLRSRCVSKSWKEVIDSTSFILSHLAVQRPRLISQNEEFEYIVLDPHTLPLFDTIAASDFGIKDKSSNLCIVSSVDGVVCLSNYQYILLWNPSIRQHLRLPIPKYMTRRSGYYFKHCGFWIDPSNNNYFKIVMFCLTIRKAWLFSSTTQSWIELAMGVVKPFYADELEETQPILIDGVCYWIAEHPHHGDMLVYFDFGQEIFGKFELPDLRQPDEGFYYNRVVRKWRGLLSVVRWEDDPPHRCGLWVMQNGSWSKMLSFNLIVSITNVLYVVEDCGRVLAETKKGHLELFDPSMGCIPLKTKFIGPCSSFRPADFVESLVFPDPTCVSGCSL